MRILPSLALALGAAAPLAAQPAGDSVTALAPAIAPALPPGRSPAQAGPTHAGATAGLSRARAAEFFVRSGTGVLSAAVGAVAGLAAGAGGVFGKSGGEDPGLAEGVVAAVVGAAVGGAIGAALPPARGESCFFSQRVAYGLLGAGLGVAAGVLLVNVTGVQSSAAVISVPLGGAIGGAGGATWCGGSRE